MLGGEGRTPGWQSLLQGLLLRTGTVPPRQTDCCGEKEMGKEPGSCSRRLEGVLEGSGLLRGRPSPNRGSCTLLGNTGYSSRGGSAAAGSGERRTLPRLGLSPAENGLKNSEGRAPER